MRLGEPSWQACRTQLAHHLPPVGYQESLARTHLADILAQAVLQIAQSNGLHATNVASRSYVVKLAPRSQLSAGPRARAIVQVTLRDGRVLRERSGAARGMPEKPLGKEGLEEKFFYCAALVMKKPQARKAADLVWNLD